MASIRQGIFGVWRTRDARIPYNLLRIPEGPGGVRGARASGAKNRGGMRSRTRPARKARTEPGLVPDRPEMRGTNPGPTRFQEMRGTNPGHKMRGTNPGPTDFHKMRGTNPGPAFSSCSSCPSWFPLTGNARNEPRFDRPPRNARNEPSFDRPPRNARNEPRPGRLPGNAQNEPKLGGIGQSIPILENVSILGEWNLESGLWSP
jgi:hypothetical protein